MLRSTGVFSAVLAALLGSSVFAEIAVDLQAIRAVDLHGAGHESAQHAWRNVASSDVAELPNLLAAMDDMGPLASNWLRAAVDSIAEKGLAAGSIPTVALERFVRDRSHAPRPRQLAFSWLIHAAPDRREPLLDGLLDDPALALRYKAVAAVMARAESEGTDQAKREVFKTALDASRDIEQIQECAAALGELGAPVDVVSHLGLIATWQIIGPFDNTGSKGFDVAYSPEAEIDFAATYDGKEGPIGWREISTEDKLGVVDLNKLVKRHKGAIDYAAAEFISDKDRPAQLRYGSYNATKVWFNGELVASNEVYHTAMDIDQYVADVNLRSGRNTILIKVCQNEQTESWAQFWQFQLRVCDRQGKALRSQPPVSVSNE